MKKLFTFILPMFSLSTLLADEAGAGQQNIVQTVIMFVVAGVFFYLILWRPERKRRKKIEEQRNRLSKGDRVTAMGIIGIIDAIKEKSVVLNMIDGSKIEVVKGAITEVQPKQDKQADTQAKPAT